MTENTTTDELDTELDPDPFIYAITPELDLAWQDQAQCLGVDPNDMQPAEADAETIAVAARVCRGCPVIEQCRELAEGQLGAYGIHAGKWYGEPPAIPSVSCAWCGDEVPNAPGGRTRLYCSTTHRVEAFKARQLSA